MTTRQRADERIERIPGLIAHEWIEPRGGSEAVASAIADAFDGSAVVTPWANAPERFTTSDITESWLARSPLRGRKALAALILPLVWRRIVPPEREFEWVIASSHLFAHHVRLRGRSAGRPKFVYVHSPARYIWNPELDGRGANLPARLASLVLRPLDRKRAREARSIAANSEYVRLRVQRAWHRDAVVIHPPVDVERIASMPDWSTAVSQSESRSLAALPEKFLLGASRFVGYKRLDVVIRAGEATGIPVVLAGGGPDRALLLAAASAASVEVTIIDEPTDEMLYALYQRAAVFVFPAVEDFGMMPVEAMAAGTPVVANSVGGARESVVPGVSGVLVDDFEPDHLAAAVREAVDLDRATIRQHAAGFSIAAFNDRIRKWVGDAV